MKEQWDIVLLFKVFPSSCCVLDPEKEKSEYVSCNLPTLKVKGYWHSSFYGFRYGYFFCAFWSNCAAMLTDLFVSSFTFLIPGGRHCIHMEGGLCTVYRHMHTGTVGGNALWIEMHSRVEVFQSERCRSKLTSVLIMCVHLFYIYVCVCCMYMLLLTLPPSLLWVVPGPQFTDIII